MAHQSTETKPTLGTEAKRPNIPKRRTKKSQLITLLSQKAGADVDAVSAKFGWQPHTTRAALSGLRKAGIERAKGRSGADKAVKYKIVMRAKTNTTVAQSNDQ